MQIDWTCNSFIPMQINKKRHPITANPNPLPQKCIPDTPDVVKLLQSWTFAQKRLSFSFTFSTYAGHFFGFLRIHLGGITFVQILWNKNHSKSIHFVQFNFFRNHWLRARTSHNNALGSGRRGSAAIHSGVVVVYTAFHSLGFPGTVCVCVCVRNTIVSHNVKSLVGLRWRALESPTTTTTMMEECGSHVQWSRFARLDEDLQRFTSDSGRAN